MIDSTDNRTATAHMPVSSHEASYFPWFDWLRAVLAIVVMLGHDELIAWHESGMFSVDVFFALSGWLIGGILLRTQRKDLPRFFFNRAIRIWIPYYIALALLLAASLLHDQITAKWFEFVSYDFLMVWNLFGTQQLADFSAFMPLQGTGNHFWSINAEEQFYLLSPLLLVLAPAWGRSIFLWVALAIGSWFVHIYPAIILGVLAAVVAVRWPNFQSILWVRLALVVLGLGSAAALAMDYSYAQFAPFCAISIVLLLAIRGTASRLGTIAGGMSYPLYLNQWIGVFVANALLGPFGLRDSLERKALACAISIGLAVALYMIVDRYLLKRRSIWFTPARGRTVMILAYAMVSTGVLLGLYLRG